MKLTIVALLVALSAPLARATEPTGYFDAAQVLSDSDEGKKNAVDEKADYTAKQAEVAAAEEAAKKANAACDKDTLSPGSAVMQIGKPRSCVEAEKAREHAASTFKGAQDEINQRQQTDAQRLLARVNRLLPVVAKAKHLAALLPAGGAFYVGPALDQTAEVIKRLNAGEGKEPVADGDASLRQQLAAKDAEIARLTALTKPPAPTVPADPPTRPPLAAKAKP